MDKYIKKPIIISAEQWLPGKQIEGLQSKVIDSLTHMPKTVYYIETLSGKMTVSEGDWIITGVNGEKYPCKPDIFEKSYKLVEE